jgi:aminoglycoside 3-N-acetyltransferase
MNASFERLVCDLRTIGVKAGDALLVHSSLKSMGHVEGGAETVIAALREVLTEEGTLLFPTLSYATSCVDHYFSNLETPSCVGAITEAFRKMQGVRRSNHPTHSVAAIGKYRDEMVGEAELDDTPVGAHSPFMKLADYKGKILLLGCPFARNTFMHGVEEIASAPYTLGDYEEFTLVDENGRKFQKSYRRHYFHRPEGEIVQRYERATEVLSEEEFSLGEIHGAASLLLDAAALQKKAAAKMREEPLYFVDDPSGIFKK